MADTTVEAAIAIETQVKLLRGTQGYAAGLLTVLARVVRLSQFPNNCKEMRFALQGAIARIGGEKGLTSPRFNKKMCDVIEDAFDTLNRQLAEQEEARAALERKGPLEEPTDAEVLARVLREARPELGDRLFDRAGLRIPSGESISGDGATSGKAFERPQPLGLVVIEGVRSEARDLSSLSGEKALPAAAPYDSPK